MLMIRLQRVGRKNDASFRILVTEKARSAKTGKGLEYVGSYFPKTKTFQYDKDRILYWISVGAQPSDTLHNMLLKEKVIEGKKINVLPKKTYTKPEVKVEEKKEVPVAVPTEPVAETPSESAPEASEAPAPEVPAEETPAE